ncbi:LLM class flavin-dependent oxidoreductase [Tessaracoccus coleopterorum]|uniref:LLM class flavin-dependent oxidoreductase n=1 Tax=Tessaracoccus coleopterorum TaxID=2714950 RepID=UPI002F90BFB0
MEFGIDTFGDITAGRDGALLPDDAVIRNVIEEAVLADELGLDAVGVGEHHRNDFAISSPEMVLAAIAARTSRIRLATAVTVLSSDDPVRVFERFATLDAISSGRAEAVVGRGSFTESFPLFGYDLHDYEELFEEKLRLFAQLMGGGRVTWKGRLTQDLADVELHPRLASGPLPTWVAVGARPSR